MSDRGTSIPQETQDRLDLNRAELTLREQMIQALNGHPVHRDSAIEILRRWDAMERVIQEARSV